VAERWRFRLVSELCFGSRFVPYELLVGEFRALVTAYSSWSLTEIMELSYRERKNWLEIAREDGKLVRKQ
jgi:hypothetical protein